MTLRAPSGAGSAGRRLWSSVTGEYDLEEHEIALLVEAVRTLALLTKLEAAIQEDGPLVDSPQGQKAHPAVVEARAQRIAFARLIAALRLPSGDEQTKAAGARPQRRVGVRGTYGLRGVAS